MASAEVLCIFCRCHIDGQKHNPYRCQKALEGDVSAMIQEAKTLREDAQEALVALAALDDGPKGPTAL